MHGFLVFCEGSADFRTVSHLVDRLLATDPALCDEDLNSIRRWRGEGELGSSYVRWRDTKRLLDKRSLGGFGSGLNGLFRGEPGDSDAHMVRRALILTRHLRSESDVPICVLILVRDTDGENERERGFQQALQQYSLPEMIEVVALAHPKREAWVLAGYEPQTAKEKRQLLDMTKELGNDPRKSPHAFTAQQDDAKRSLKRIFRCLELTPDRETDCLDAPLDLLHRRGKGSGLSAFLDQIQNLVVNHIRAELH